MSHKLVTCILTTLLAFAVVALQPSPAFAQAASPGAAAGADSSRAAAQEPVGSDERSTSTPADAPVADDGAEKRAGAEAQAPRETLFTPEHRLEIYETSKLSYLDAILWQLLFPGLGNIYAKQYFNAGIAFVLMGFAAVFAGYAFRTDQPQFYGWAAGTAGLAYVGGGVLAVFGVRDYNAELRDGLKVPDAQARRPSAVPMALGPALTISF